MEHNLLSSFLPEHLQILLGSLLRSKTGVPLEIAGIAALSFLLPTLGKINHFFQGFSFTFWTILGMLKWMLLQELMFLGQMENSIAANCHIELNFSYLLLRENITWLIWSNSISFFMFLVLWSCGIFKLWFNSSLWWNKTYII